MRRVFVVFESFYGIVIKGTFPVVSASRWKYGFAGVTEVVIVSRLCVSVSDV